MEVDRELERNNSVPGPEGISYKAVQILHHLKPDTLFTLFNDCIPEGVPGKDVSTADPYRPITQPSVVDKILKKMQA